MFIEGLTFEYHSWNKKRLQQKYNSNRHYFPFSLSPLFLLLSGSFLDLLFFILKNSDLNNGNWSIKSCKKYIKYLLVSKHFLSIKCLGLGCVWSWWYKWFSSTQEKSDFIYRLRECFCIITHTMLFENPTNSFLKDFVIFFMVNIPSIYYCVKKYIFQNLVA